MKKGFHQKKAWNEIEELPQTCVNNIIGSNSLSHMIQNEHLNVKISKGSIKIASNTNVEKTGIYQKGSPSGSFKESGQNATRDPEGDPVFEGYCVYERL